MSKLRTLHRCDQCGWTTSRWAGRCGDCGQWNTLRESTTASVVSATTLEHHSIVDLRIDSVSRVSSGCGELDRVLGGGLVPGGVALLGGEPGIGKSTLLLQMLGTLAATGKTVLLITGEESEAQVRMRAERLGALSDSLRVVASTCLDSATALIRQLRPTVAVIDSIQTMEDEAIDSTAGSVTQVRGCAAALVKCAKETGISVVLVGQVTKDGTLAGPRVLEHVVDTVLSFEGERHGSLRLLRAVKNRFGSTEELGLFEMAENGLREVADAGKRFLADRQDGLSGSVVLPALDGQRPLIVEVQALVSRTNLAQPRRSALGGLDGNRLSLLCAVLERRASFDLSSMDVYASIVGGVRVTEPAADLAIGLALASACADRAISADVAAAGEIGLGGEVRTVGQIERRAREAARVGIRKILVPATGPIVQVPGVESIPVRTLAEAIATALPRSTGSSVG